MGLSRWRAEAPANIALIKYMGKADAAQNQPANGSLSYSLDHLVSVVEIAWSESDQDSWAGLEESGLEVPVLSRHGEQRFLAHFSVLKQHFGMEGFFTLRSANNFPSDCGLASSASSFAALTKAAHQVALSRARDPQWVESLTLEDLAKLSQRGSGSSCRSFFSPWGLWTKAGAQSLALPFSHLHHQVVILNARQKAISSSEAHARVVKSLLFQGRPERAEQRLRELLTSLNRQDWARAFALVWSDFWDMHALFETSAEPFGYMSSNSLTVLEWLRQMWRTRGDGPLVTMDAGPNIHLLYRPDQVVLAAEVKSHLSEMAMVIPSPGLKGQL